MKKCAMVRKDVLVEEEQRIGEMLLQISLSKEKDEGRKKNGRSKEKEKLERERGILKVSA